MYSQVINYIKQRVEISREEIEENLQYSEFKTYAKGEYVLRAGEYCRFIGFLNKGFIVTTITDSTGDEKAAEFKHKGCFFTYTEGLAGNTPFRKNFIAVEDCEALLLNKEYLPLIFKANPVIGLVILTGFKFNGDDGWKGGDIYDPESSKTYSSGIYLKDKNTLKLRGFIGISLFGRTETWTSTN